MPHIFASVHIHIFDGENPEPYGRRDLRRDYRLVYVHSGEQGPILNPRGVLRSHWHQLVIVMDFVTERQHIMEKIYKGPKRRLDIMRKREDMLQWCCHNDIVVVQPQWIRTCVERGKMLGHKEYWGGWRVKLQFETPEEQKAREAREAAKARESREVAKKEEEKEHDPARKEQKDQQHEEEAHGPPSSPLSALSSVPPSPRTKGGGRMTQARGQRRLPVAEGKHGADIDNNGREQEGAGGEGDESPDPISKGLEQGSSEEGGSGKAEASTTKPPPVKGRRRPARGQQGGREREPVPPERLPTPVSQSQPSSESGQSSSAPRKRKLPNSSPPPSSQSHHAGRTTHHSNPNASPGPSRAQHRGALPSPESLQSYQQHQQPPPSASKRRRQESPSMPLVQVKEERDKEEGDEGESDTESYDHFTIRDLNMYEIDMESRIFRHLDEPLTFSVMPQAGKRPIELMIRENGGDLVDTDKALFVIVPVNPPMRPRGLHPKASVVYADWIWDSVRDGRRKDYECYESRMPPLALKKEVV